MNLIQNEAYFEASDVNKFFDFCKKVDGGTCLVRVSMFDLMILWLQATKMIRKDTVVCRFIKAYEGCLDITDRFVDDFKNKIGFETEEKTFNIEDSEVADLIENLTEDRMIFRFYDKDYFIDNSALKTLGSSFHVPPQMFEERSLASAISAAEMLCKTEREYNILVRNDLGMAKIVAFIGRRYQRHSLTDIMDVVKASGLSFIKGTWSDTVCHIYLTDGNTKLKNGQIPIIDIMTSDTCHYSDSINFGWGTKDSPEEYYISSVMSYPDSLGGFLNSVDIKAEENKYLKILDAVNKEDVKTIIKLIGSDISVSDKKAIENMVDAGRKPVDAIFCQFKDVNDGFAKQEYRKAFKNLEILV